MSRPSDTGTARPGGTSEPGWASGWRYACAGCAAAYDIAHADYCEHCGFPVLAERLDTADGANRANRADRADGRPAAASLGVPGPGLWRYAAHLPLDPDASWLSLAESLTPSIPAPALAERVGAGQVWLKLDHLHGTGSFKDRASAAGVAHALATGARGVVCASSGNAAASVSAYAARAGLPAIIVVPEQVPPAKLAACVAHGAIPLAVPGDYSHSFALARELCQQLGLANVATTYVNPHAVAGLRSMAFDLVEQVGRTVDWVHVPTGAGPLVHGVVAGFGDLLARGSATRVPHTVAVQPDGCAPIVRAWTDDVDAVGAWPQVTSGVSGINDPLRGYAGDGTVTLRDVRKSGGRAVAVADADIDAARRMLGERFGIYVEPAAAASVASLFATASEYAETDVVVCLLTGHGLKTGTVGELDISVVSGVADAVAALRRAGWEDLTRESEGRR